MWPRIGCLRRCCARAGVASAELVERRRRGGRRILSRQRALARLPAHAARAAMSGRKAPRRIRAPAPPLPPFAQAFPHPPDLTRLSAGPSPHSTLGAHSLSGASDQTAPALRHRSGNEPNLASRSAAISRAGPRAIVLVPRSPSRRRFVGQLRRRFGETVAVLHSRCAGERYAEWSAAAGRRGAGLRRAAPSAVVAPIAISG